MAELRAADSDSGAYGKKRGESLGALSRKFAALFVESEPGSVLSLEAAAGGMQRRESTPEPGEESPARKEEGGASKEGERESVCVSVSVCERVGLC